jgi:OPT family oligopeptide transporter
MAFSNDLKLAHYTHIKPSHTFICQMVATLIFTFVSAGILNFQMSFKDVCTKNAQFGFTCPGHNTFFTSAVFWGTLSPKRLFGPGRRYNMMLLGFPIGIMIPFVHWALRKKWPRSEFLRQIHPVMIPAGPALWGSPYNIGNFFPNVPVVWFSWQYLRRKYPGFWGKYNFVVAAAFPAGIAISAVVIFFALQLPAGGLSIDWWGNSVVGAGCDGGCVLKEIPEVGYFGPAPGSGLFT